MKKMYAAVALLVIFVLVQGAYAIPRPEPEPSPGQTETRKQRLFSGAVEKFDVKGGVVVVTGSMMQEKTTLTFYVNDKTKIWRGNMLLHIGDLERKMQVRVEYQSVADKLYALTIEVTER
jgi:hypothetical protein